MNQNILVVGSGVREAIIIKRLVLDSKLYFNKNKKYEIRIICLGNNKNPYIEKTSDLHIVNKFSIQGLLDLIESIKIDTINFVDFQLHSFCFQ